MSNVLISYFSDYGETMYDAISQVLRENGNNVFRFNINNSKVYRTQWGGISKIIDKQPLEDIKKFNAEIVFNFNNSLPENCYELLNENCKICIIDADNPETFWNKDYHLSHKSKYLYFRVAIVL